MRGKKEFKGDSEIKNLDNQDSSSFICKHNENEQVARKDYNYGCEHIEFKFYVAGRTASWKCQLEIV